MNKGETRKKILIRTVFTQGRDVFRTLSNTVQKYLMANNRWLFSEKRSIVDIWQGSKYVFEDY